MLVSSTKNMNTKKMLETDGYSIKKTGSNLEITMPVAHDVYTSHQVQNKTVSTNMMPSYVVTRTNSAYGEYQDDSNESSV